MKKVIINFKQYIRFLASIITSREFAVIYVLCGTLAQVAHTYYLVEGISSLDGGWRTTQAIILSIFISSSLLYFTAISDNTDSKEAKRVHFAVTMFTIIEILINIYYYSRYLIISQEEARIFDYIFAILISCLIPVTIKLYSSHIRAKEWIIDIEEGREALISKSVESSKLPNINEEDTDLNSNVSTDIKPVLQSNHTSNETQPEIDQEFINKYIELRLQKFEEEIRDAVISENKVNFETWMLNKRDEIQQEIQKSFKTNSELFLQQFENRVKLISSNQLNK